MALPMNAHRASRTESKRGSLASLAVAIACASVSAPAFAQEDTFLDSWIESIAESMSPRWTGPRVPWPEPGARPRVDGVLQSALDPVNVQVASERVDPELAADALAALERAHDWLASHGWPTPAADGGYGGTEGFDLYLVDEVASAAPIEDAEPPVAQLASAAVDTPNAWSALDGAITHALVDVDVDPRRLEACVTSAYVRAALLSLDPAEAPSWRAATGDYVAWLVTGDFGCSDDAIVRQQHDSWRTWIGDDETSAGGGALFMAMLSARTDGLTGDFIRDLWSGAPQITWEGTGLRAAPDMWQVVHRVMEVGRDPLPRLIEEMAVARWFAGDPSREAGAPLAFLRELPEEAAVPLMGNTRWENLPRRFEPHALELEPLGSAYLVVDTTAAQPGSVLRIWLRGEYGVGWALSAVRIAEDGVERGRVRAPVRPRTPRSYIPLELPYGEAAKVLIVVTNMGGRLVDADAPNDQVRSFRLVLDKLEPGAPAPQP